MKHLLIIFSLIFNNLLLASEFKYHTVYYCGPEKLGILDWYMVLGKKRYDYFFINFSDNEKFVILHRDIQYTNFRDTKINTLYNQQGGTFYATMKEIEGVLVFKLLDREDTGYVKT